MSLTTTYILFFTNDWQLRARILLCVWFGLEIMRVPALAREQAGGNGHASRR